MNSKFLIQKVNYHQHDAVAAWFVTEAENPFEAIDQGFDRWAPDVHYGYRTVRGNGKEWEACLRDANHLVRATLENSKNMLEVVVGK